MTEKVPPAERILEDFYPREQGQLEHVRRMPEKDPETVSADRVLPQRIADRLGHDLYTHQADALGDLDFGENICVATSTSSGKTLIYALYAAKRHLEDRPVRGLLVYPTKALSRDQKQALTNLYERLGLNIDVMVYDGDTSSKKKREIRNKANLIITNFAGLNYYLPHHNLWGDIFSDLELIAIDESHSYTGILGMHVAWIIRRLKRVIQHYGGDPQYILTSATIGNPAEHARTLTGEDVLVIDEDGSPKGARDIVFWNPPLSDDDVGQSHRKPASIAARDVVTHLANEDIQTLAFARSRKMTELTSHRIEELVDDGDTPWDGPVDVEPYHAGHGKETRRETEDKLQEGAIDAIVSTSALELGIDIGSVDAVSVIGYPGTRQSFWQQIGRSGRGGSRALSIFVGDHSGIDQYLMSNPDHLIDGDVEDAVIDLQNNQVYAQHLLAAANELSITRRDIGILGDEERLRQAVEGMFVQKGLMKGSLATGARYNGSGRPEKDINLYATGDDEFEIELSKSAEGDEIDMEPIQKERAYRDYHEGATFLHRGERYVVTKMLDRPGYRRVFVRPAPNIDYYTQSRSETTIGDVTVEEKRKINGCTLYRGTGSVTVHYQFFDKIDIDSNDRLEQMIPTGLPPLKMKTQMCWLEVPESLEEHLVSRYADYESKGMEGDPYAGYMGGLHAAEHGMIEIAQLELMMDGGDIGGLSVLGHPDIDPSGYFIYDGVAGGIGFADKIYEQFETVAERTREMITQCDCTRERGCPACVMDDNCGDGNRPLHKSAATDIFDYLLEGTPEQMQSQRDDDVRTPNQSYTLSATPLVDVEGRSLPNDISRDNE